MHFSTVLAGRRFGGYSAFKRSVFSRMTGECPSFIIAHRSMIMLKALFCSLEVLLRHYGDPLLVIFVRSPLLPADSLAKLHGGEFAIRRGSSSG